MRSGPFRNVVQEGTLALNCGWDPIEYLSLTGTARLVAREILQEAAEREAARQKAFWKNLEAVVQNGVAKAFGGRK